MKPEVPCTYRRLSDTTLCNLRDRLLPGARVVCASVRVTTQRSAVVTRTKSEPKCVSQWAFLKTRSTAPGITVSIAEYLFIVGSDKRKRLVYTRYRKSVLSVATTAKWQPRHLRVVQQVHQRKLRSIFKIGQSQKACPSSKKEQPHGSVLFSRRLSAFNSRAMRPTIAYGGCFAVLIIYQSQACPAYFKGGVYHHHKNAHDRFVRANSSVQAVQ